MISSTLYLRLFDAFTEIHSDDWEGYAKYLYSLRQLIHCSRNLFSVHVPRIA
jgi:hypothetical protein